MKTRIYNYLVIKKSKKRVRNEREREKKIDNICCKHQTIQTELKEATRKRESRTRREENGENDSQTSFFIYIFFFICFLILALTNCAMCA